MSVNGISEKVQDKTSVPETYEDYIDMLIIKKKDYAHVYTDTCDVI